MLVPAGRSPRQRARPERLRATAADHAFGRHGGLSDDARQHRDLIICGTIYGLSAWALGLPYPLALAFIAGFLDLIPMVGATVAGVILVLAALTQGVPEAVIMLLIVLVYQQIENYVLQPTILGRAADVSGFLVIAGVLVFGTALGAVGAIIAVPIVASIQIVVRELTARRRAEMAELRRRAATVPDTFV